MTLEYITNRELQNRSGEPKGKIKILKMREEDHAQVDFTCPECGANDKRKESWAEPFTSGEKSKQRFMVKCGKCGFVLNMLKLKKEAAKKK